MEKRWSMIIADSDAFVTTDKPVGLKHQTRPVFGFRTPGVIVSFPVSPTRLLVMDDMHHEPANQYYPLKPLMSGAFNYHIWTSGSRFMIQVGRFQRCSQNLLRGRTYLIPKTHNFAVERTRFARCSPRR